MATVYKRTQRKPIPQGAEIVERRGERFAVWKDSTGRHSARLAKDGKAILLDRPGYIIKYFDENGKRCKESVRAGDLETARQIAGQRELAVLRRERGIFDPAQERTADENRRPLAEHVADFGNFLADKGNTPKHVRMTCQHVRWVAARCEAQQISDLTGPAVLRAIGELRTSGGPVAGKRKTKVAASLRTCNSYLTSLKAFTRWLWEHKRTTGDALCGLDGFNAETDRRHVRRELTPEEMAWLLAETEKHTLPEHNLPGPDRAMVYRLALGTGFRASELRSLTPESFDLASDPPTVTVGASYSKRRREDQQPIRPDLAALLRPWVADRAAGVPVFATLPGNTARMLRSDLRTARKAWIAAAPVGPEREARERSDFLKYRNAAGEVADFHATRHTYISGVVAGGASVKTAQELARHSTPVLTIGRYSHARLHDLQGALESLPDLTGNPDPASEGNREVLHATGTGDARGESSGPQRPVSSPEGRDQKSTQLNGEQCIFSPIVEDSGETANRGVGDVEKAQVLMLSRNDNRQQLAGSAGEKAPPGFEPGMADLQSAALAAWLRRLRSRS